MKSVSQVENTNRLISRRRERPGYRGHHADGREVEGPSDFEAAKTALCFDVGGDSALATANGKSLW